MSNIEGSTHACTDQVVSDFEDRRQLPHQLVEFSRQLHYLLAQITEGSARLIVRLNEAANGFESWRKLHARFALPDRARGVSLLSQLLKFKLRDAHSESDLTEFLSLKSRHEKATSRPLQDDLLVTMMVNKTQGPLQQHLRLNVGDLTTIDDALEIVKNCYQSRHLANWKHMSSNHDTPGPMDTGPLKGKGRNKGFGKGFGKRFSKGKERKEEKGKGKFKGTWKGKEIGKEKAKARKEKEKEQDVSFVDPIRIGAESVPRR